MASNSTPPSHSLPGGRYTNEEFAMLLEIATDDRQTEFLGWLVEHAPIPLSQAYERLCTHLRDNREADRAVDRYRRLDLITIRPRLAGALVRTTDRTQTLLTDGPVEAIRQTTTRPTGSTDRWAVDQSETRRE